MSSMLISRGTDPAAWGGSVQRSVASSSVSSRVAGTMVVLKRHVYDRPRSVSRLAPRMCTRVSPEVGPLAGLKLDTIGGGR